MDAPPAGAPGDGAPGSAAGGDPGGEPGGDPSGDRSGDQGADAELVVDVLHRVGRCPLQSLTAQPELVGWTSVRLEQAVGRAWNGGLVFIDPNDDLVALEQVLRPVERHPHLPQNAGQDP